MGTALAAALDRVGDRWSLLLVEALLGGPRRWSDLSEDVTGIAPNVLSDRLRRLEQEGVVSAEPYSDRPLRLAYDLTAAGRELAGAVRLLTDWGARREDGTVAPRHLACGTPMEARWHCPTCDLTVEGDLPDERTEIVTV
jgi:DNA-binding HxlR family transcriptional regulator